MKIGMREIDKSIYLVSLDKLERSLIKEGFTVEKGNQKAMYDILAVKDNDRRIYVIKIGKNKNQIRTIKQLQSIANEQKARLFVTYVERPRTKSIKYDGIEELLYQYLFNNLPDELDALSTHTIIDDVSDVELEAIHIKGNVKHVEGCGTLGVILYYGSQSDRDKGDGDQTCEYFEFVFRVNIKNDSIVSSYFKFDTEHFYE